MPTIVNPDDRTIWPRQFNVTLDHLLPTLQVYAECSQDALDEAADYALEQQWDIELTGDDLTDAEGFDEVDYVGNFCTPISSISISIVDVTGDEW